MAILEVTECAGCGEAYNPLGPGDDVETIDGVEYAIHFYTAAGEECGAITRLSGEWLTPGEVFALATARMVTGE